MSDLGIQDMLSESGTGIGNLIDGIQLPLYKIILTIAIVFSAVALLYALVSGVMYIFEKYSK